MYRLRAIGIRDKPIAPGSPWQNGFAERLIGSIRRECVDHLVVLGEAHLRRILTKYATYYNGLRTHRSPSSPLLPNLVFSTHTLVRDASAGSCRAERRGTNRAGLARSKSSIPITPGHSHEAVDGAVRPSEQ